MTKASLQYPMTQFHLPYLGGHKSLPLEAESLREDVKENSLDLSELDDDR